jgi:hypothetical protein
MTGFLLSLVLWMWLFPETPVARHLHRHLVEKPVERLGAFERHKVIFWFVACIILAGSAQIVAMLGSAELVTLMAWDLSIYIDAVVATWTLAAVARGKAAYHSLRSSALRLPNRILRSCRRLVRIRSRRARTAAKPANDDEGLAVWALAA